MKRTLATLLILMLVLSVAVSVNFNSTDNSLFHAELIAPFHMITHGELPAFQAVAWVLLLVTHCGMLLLPFLIKYKHFQSLLVGLPILFIVFYMIYASVFIVVLLIPFIISWIVCVIESRRNEQGNGKRLRQF